jgi:hypothetical protein
MAFLNLAEKLAMKSSAVTIELNLETTLYM